MPRRVWSSSTHIACLIRSSDFCTFRCADHDERRSFLRGSQVIISTRFCIGRSDTIRLRPELERRDLDVVGGQLARDQADDLLPFRRDAREGEEQRFEVAYGVRSRQGEGILRRSLSVAATFQRRPLRSPCCLSTYT